MPVTAKSRARTGLRAATTLTPADVLALIKGATGGVKGGGASLMTSGVMNAGARVHVEREFPDRLALSINSGKRLVELCTFTALVETAKGTSYLTIGGLETYKTKQSRLLGFIPMGPASVAGFSLYKRFLDEVTAQLFVADPAVNTSILVFP
ncbi:MAG: hypothetical protein JSS97_11610 [Actinobacteria bacterium]|nr:hypothetical protein [Actinomycetota bacterium]